MDWIDRLAGELGEDPLSKAEIGRLLGAARDIAHRVERKATPLGTFLLGSAVGRLQQGGASRDAALSDALDTLAAALREAPGEPSDEAR